MKYELVLIDLDDTLFDYSKTEDSAFRKTFEKMGFFQVNQIEKEKIEEQQKNIQEELNKIEPVIKRLDRSIEALSYADRTIVVERFINGASWMRIADVLHLSEPAVRKRSGRVLEKVSMMMFGPLSIPLQMHFVFTDRN